MILFLGNGIRRKEVKKNRTLQLSGVPADEVIWPADKNPLKYPFKNLSRGSTIEKKENLRVFLA